MDPRDFFDHRLLDPNEDQENISCFLMNPVRGALSRNDSVRMGSATVPVAVIGVPPMTSLPHTPH